MRNDKGQFIKGYGFWTGKKRPGLKTSTSFKKGSIPWNKNKSGTYKMNVDRKGQQRNTGKTHFKKGQEPWNKGKEWKEMQGENHPMWGKHRVDMQGENNVNWKGGTTLEREKARKSIEYKQWRIAVFIRDNFTCQICGEKERVRSKLEADHIKPWSLFPELRFNISNGRTLCHECHKATFTYLNVKMERSSFL